LPAKSAAAAVGRAPIPRRKTSTPPKITVTITSSDASWSVSALRGTKSVTKSVAVPPGVVTAIADLLDQSGISAAVAEVNETALAEAEQRAAQLRVELAELDAVLAAHRSPR
jgi:sulfur carrier protein ThiS